MNIDKLKELASKATPGPWELSHAGMARRGEPFKITEFYVRLPDADFALAADIVDDAMKPSEANAAFIAAANPDVVLALIEVAEKAKAHIDAADAEDEIGAFKSWNALRSALSRLHGGQG